MVTIITTSGGSGEQANKSGGTDWFDKLVPIGLLAALGYVMYTLIVGNQNQTGSGTLFTGGGGGGSGAAQQQQQQPTQNAPGGGNSIAAAKSGGSTLAQLINTPGTYVNTATGQVGQGTGINNLFVNAGPQTPSNFFPLGNVITTSRDTSTQEQADTLSVLISHCGEINNNAWYCPAAPATPIPILGSSRKSCPGPGPGAPATDTWHYC